MRLELRLFLLGSSLLPGVRTLVSYTNVFNCSQLVSLGGCRNVWFQDAKEKDKESAQSCALDLSHAGQETVILSSHILLTSI